MGLCVREGKPLTGGIGAQGKAGGTVEWAFSHRKEKRGEFRRFPLTGHRPEYLKLVGWEGLE